MTTTQYPITSQAQLRASFWDHLAETSSGLAALRRSRKTQNDYPADIRMAWVDYVDGAARSGTISEALANRATL